MVRPTRITLKHPELHSSYAFLLLMQRISLISSTEYVLLPTEYGCVSDCPITVSSFRSAVGLCGSTHFMKFSFSIMGTAQLGKDAVIVAYVDVKRLGVEKSSYAESVWVVV